MQHSETSPLYSCAPVESPGRDAEAKRSFGRRAFFFTITGPDWRRAMVPQTNSVAEQIRAAEMEIR